HRHAHAARSLSFPSIVNVSVPRNMATFPVRTISVIPIGFSSSIRALILSSAPIASTMYERRDTSTIFARKMSTPFRSSLRVFSSRNEMVWRMSSVRAMTRQDLHHTVLAGQLELLDSLLLDLFRRGEVRAPLKVRQLPLERHVLFVELPELGNPIEQRLYQFLVFSLHSAPSLAGKSVANMRQNGLSTRH